MVQKITQICESDIDKFKHRETAFSINNKFSGAICKYAWLKTIFWIKKKIFNEFITKKTQRENFCTAV